jgi:hypothetical protein
MRSCSSAGSPASFAMAASSARVISCSIRFEAMRPNSAVHQTGARRCSPRLVTGSVRRTCVTVTSGFRGRRCGCRVP